MSDKIYILWCDEKYYYSPARNAKTVLDIYSIRKDAEAYIVKTGATKKGNVWIKEDGDWFGDDITTTYTIEVKTVNSGN